MAERQVDIDIVMNAISQSSKYEAVNEDTLFQIASWAMQRSSSNKEAIKIAKRKLHQIFAAFLSPRAKGRIRNLVEDAIATKEKTYQQDICKKILRLHASTAERIPILEEYGRMLNPYVPDGGTIVDLACGLNPFTLPWLNLPHNIQYYAYDIDKELMEYVDRFLKHYNPISTGVCLDVIVTPPKEAVDVTLLLKTATTLEQQLRGSTLKLLRSLDTRLIVISFPTRSLGGRNKGMEHYYSTLARQIITALDVPSDEFLLDNELFYLLHPRHNEGSTLS